MSTLSCTDPLLDVSGIALRLYGKADKTATRRVRHLIARGVIPTKKTAGRIESRCSWVDAAFAEPDNLNGRSEK
jgi:hypothetical protein